MRPLLVIVGPSGSGKSTAVSLLVEWGVITLKPTWTTRPLRADETADAVEHRFVDEPTLQKGLNSGQLIDAMSLFGLPYRYGLPRLDIANEGPVTTLMGRAHLLSRLRQHTSDVRVYHIEAPADAVRQRLEARRQSGTEMGNRWELFNEELRLGREAAERCFENNRTAEALARELEAAIRQDYGLWPELR